MYGVITEEMLALIEPLVKGRVVVDLGCGGCEKTILMGRLGAAKVIGVDKIAPPRFFPNHTSEKFEAEHLQEYFEGVKDKLPAEFDVALVSWPQNCDQPGLVELCGRAKVVIYLGCNWGGTACGFPELYRHLAGRELLAEVMVPRNTFQVLGGTLSEPRIPTFEEYCGVYHIDAKVWGDRNEPRKPLRPKAVMPPGGFLRFVRDDEFFIVVETTLGKFHWDRTHQAWLQKTEPPA